MFPQQTEMPHVAERSHFFTNAREAPPAFDCSTWCRRIIADRLLELVSASINILDSQHRPPQRILSIAFRFSRLETMVPLLVSVCRLRLLQCAERKRFAMASYSQLRTCINPHDGRAIQYFDPAGSDSELPTFFCCYA